MFVTKARVSSFETMTVLVDTGATYVAITRKVADRAHLDLEDAPRHEIMTANGKREGVFVILPSVAVGALSTERVPAVVVDDLGPIDGLLGQSFLSRFEMKQSGGILDLSIRAPSSSQSAAGLPGKAPAAVAAMVDGG
jgi:aspartyl protease family protein